MRRRRRVVLPLPHRLVLLPSRRRSAVLHVRGWVLLLVMVRQRRQLHPAPRVLDSKVLLLLLWRRRRVMGVLRVLHLHQHRLRGLLAVHLLLLVRRSRGEHPLQRAALRLGACPVPGQLAPQGVHLGQRGAQLLPQVIQLLLLGCGLLLRRSLARLEVQDLGLHRVLAARQLRFDLLPALRLELHRALVRSLPARTGQTGGGRSGEQRVKGQHRRAKARTAPAQKRA